MRKQKDRKKAKALEEGTVVAKTEWQKRHEIFLERQRARQEAEQKRLEEEAAQRKEELEQLTKKKEETETVADGSENGVEDKKNPVVNEKVTEKAKKLSFMMFKKNSAQTEEEKRVKRPARVALTKAISVLVTSLFVLLVSVFFISPLSKEKLFVVTGTVNASQKAVMSATGIRTSHYITDVLFNRDKYEEAITETIPWVKKAHLTYEFPNKFTIEVEENRIIAYAQTRAGYQPVLENGTRMAAVTEDKLPGAFLTVNLSKEKDVQTLVKKLATLDKKLVSEIHVINPIPKSVTKDLILLEMKTGHQIRVPLSQIDIKLPFYLQLKDALAESSIIDMEVGVYSTTEGIEALIKEEMPQREADAKARREAEKKAEEELRKAEEEQKRLTEEGSTSETSESSSEEQTELVTDPELVTETTVVSETTVATESEWVSE